MLAKEVCAHARTHTHTNLTKREHIYKHNETFSQPNPTPISNRMARRFKRRRTSARRGRRGRSSRRFRGRRSRSSRKFRLAVQRIVARTMEPKYYEVGFSKYLDNTFTYEDVNPLTQGVGFTQRIGHRVNAMKFNANIYLSVLDFANLYTFNVRVMLIWEKRANHSPVMTDILSDTVTWWTSNYQPERCRANYKILFDRNICFQSAKDSAKTLHLRIPLRGKQVIWSSSTATDISTGSMYLIAVSDVPVTNPQTEVLVYTVNYRFWFKDA